MFESSHDESYGVHAAGKTPLNKQYEKTFTDLNFPVTKEIEAWKEKVSYHYFRISLFVDLNFILSFPTDQKDSSLAYRKRICDGCTIKLRSQKTHIFLLKFIVYGHACATQSSKYDIFLVSILIY